MATKDEIAAARSIAKTIAELAGPDLRDLSDDDLVQRSMALIAAFADGARHLALSCQQAATAFEALASAYAKAEAKDVKPNASLSGGRRPSV